ncbi:MAG TPA: hypothetical protein VID27_10145 [Blastocatellia bacterium]
MSTDKAKSKRQKAKIVLRSLLVITLFLPGCGKPFNVKPRPDTPPHVAGASATVSSIALEAEAVKDEDYLYDTFEANLLMAGVLPVRVRIANRGTEPVSLKKSRFEVRSDEPRAYKAITAGEAFNRVFSFYGISVYSKSGYRESKDDFLSHAIDLNSPLAGGESREGLMFFPVPDDITRRPGLKLVARRLRSGEKKSDSAIELKLN